jgi:hypothetical protein
VRACDNRPATLARDEDCKFEKGLPAACLSRGAATPGPISRGADKRPTFAWLAHGHVSILDTSAHLVSTPGLSHRSAGVAAGAGCPTALGAIPLWNRGIGQTACMQGHLITPGGVSHPITVATLRELIDSSSRF